MQWEGFTAQHSEVFLGKGAENMRQIYKRTAMAKLTSLAVTNLNLNGNIAGQIISELPGGTNKSPIFSYSTMIFK